MKQTIFVHLSVLALLTAPTMSVFADTYDAGNAIATGINATAVGQNAKAAGMNSVAVGNNAIANGHYSLALGLDAKVDNTYGMAMGQGSHSIGAGDVAVGTQAHAIGKVPVGGVGLDTPGAASAFGWAAHAEGTHATAIGYLSTAGAIRGWDNTINKPSYTPIDNTVGTTAIGSYSSAEKMYTSSLGYQAKATDAYATALGTNTQANGYGSMAAGYGSVAKDNYSVSLGYNNTAVGSSIAIGTENRTTGVKSIGIGTNAQIDGMQSVGVGENTKAGNYGVAIGLGAEAKTTYGVAIGLYSKANNGVAGIAIGEGAEGSGIYSVANGFQAKATGGYGIATGLYSVASGIGSIATSTYASAKGHYSLANGYLSNTNKDAFGSIAHGLASTVDEKWGTALGAYSRVVKVGSVALGSGTYADAPVGTESITIAGKTYRFAGTNPYGAVSIGKSSEQNTGHDGTDGQNADPYINLDIKRTITNVAAGRINKDSTDAINGSQLHAVIQSIEDLSANNTPAINNRINEVEDESKAGDAMNAALSALKPLTYDPREPHQIMAGIGSYKDKRAVALGYARYFNESTLAHIGIAHASGNGVMLNGGVSFKFGFGQYPKGLLQYEKGPISSIYVLQEENIALHQKVDEQEKRIIRLENLLLNKDK